MMSATYLLLLLIIFFYRNTFRDDKKNLQFAYRLKSSLNNTLNRFFRNSAVFKKKISRCQKIRKNAFFRSPETRFEIVKL